MKAPWSGQLSVAKAGWLIALLFFAWLAFLFVPGPKKPEPQPAPPPVKPPLSRLVALGLPDNSDFEKLPEMFARFADKAPWSGDRVEFAYWHPGAQRFEYFFEATRTTGLYRFRVIPGQDLSYFPEESETWPVFFYTSFIPRVQLVDPNSMDYSGRYPKPRPPMKVDVQLDKQPISPPAPPPLNLNSAK